MKIPIKKLKDGFEMPVFGLGTWMMGGSKVYNPANNDEADIFAIQRAIDAGITHIDTAQNYADGQAEKLVGQAIKKYNRSKLFIVTKVKRENLAFNTVISSVGDSLKRLDLDYVDLLFIHAPNPEIPIKETMKAFDQLVREGRVKHVGVSNFTIERLQEAQAYSESKIVANQLHLNLIYRESEKKGLIDYCQQNDVMFVAWRPVEKGILSQAYNTVLDKICKKYNKTPAQVAINWLISQKNVVTLSKMSAPHHLEENLGGVGWEMDSSDLILLRKDYPGQKFISNVVPLI